MTSATGPSPAEPDPAPDGAERRIPGVTPALRRRLRSVFRLLAALSPSLAARVALRLFLTPRAHEVGAAESGFLVDARRVRLAVATPSGDRYDIAAYEWQPTGAGAAPGAPNGNSAPRTVLVMHGWISHAARLGPLIAALRGAGLRVIACDAPAHGHSSGRRADLHGFLGAARATEAALGPADALIAHSFGALTAATWMAGEDAPRALRAAVLVGLMRDVDWVFSSFTHTIGLGGKALARLRALFRARYGGHPEDYSTHELARRIHLPVLLVHGEEDELVPAGHSTEVGAVLARGEVVRLPGMRHSTPLREPQSIALMLRFLAERLA